MPAPNTKLSGLDIADGGQLRPDGSTANAVAGAATLSKQAGIITSEALTTAAAATYALTLTNSLVAATSIVLVEVQFGTSTTGDPVVGRVTPGAGSVVVNIVNRHASVAFNGTIKISFFVLNTQ